MDLVKIAKYGEEYMKMCIRYVHFVWKIKM